MNGSA